MMGRSHGEAGIRVMGRILFPVTLPDGGAARVTAGSGLSPRVSHSEAFLTQPSPRLPQHAREAPAMCGAASILFHATVLAAVVVLGGIQDPRTVEVDSPRVAPIRFEIPKAVFTEPRPRPGRGGGGGGNRQKAPATRAQAPGRDSITLPVAKPVAPPPQPRDELPSPPTLTLDALPLASGSAFQIGLLSGPALLDASRGPGSGGGTGEGIGTGIGSGRGSGLGPGSGGGTGGGVYRLGSGVTPPTLLLNVKPAYTAEAMRAKIQGSVFLEVVVQRDGTPRDIRVVRSLDPRGLDWQAVLAVEQWRFGPGRLNGVPVDVLVNVVIDFRIH